MKKYIEINIKIIFDYKIKNFTDHKNNCHTCLVNKTCIFFKSILFK